MLGRELLCLEMKKKLLCLLSMLIISSPVFAQRTRTDTDPVMLDMSVKNSLFSPVAKSTEGVVFKAEVKNAKKTKLWFLTIRNSETNKKTREMIETKTPVPEKIIWDGLTSDMDIAPDGHYSYKFFVLTDKGSYVLEKANIITID